MSDPEMTPTPYAAGAAKLKDVMKSEVRSLVSAVAAELRKMGHLPTIRYPYAIEAVDSVPVRFSACVIQHAFGGLVQDVHYYARRRVTLKKPVGGWNSKRIAQLLVAAAESRRIAEAMRQEAGNAHANRIGREIATARDAGINREDVYEDADGTYTIKLHGLTREQVVAVGKALQKARGEG